MQIAELWVIIWLLYVNIKKYESRRETIYLLIIPTCVVAGAEVLHFIYMYVCMYLRVEKRTSAY